MLSVTVQSGVCVYLSSRVAIVEFIFISQSKLIREFLLHLIIRHLFTDSLRTPKRKILEFDHHKYSCVMCWTAKVRYSQRQSR